LNNNIHLPLKPTIVYGAGGHARSVLDVIHAQGMYKPICIIDRIAGGTFCHLPVMGEEDVNPDEVGNAIIAIGCNSTRAVLYKNITKKGFKLVNIISPLAYVSTTATLGTGIVVMHGAIIGPGSKVNDGVIINTCASVDHDCTIEEFSHIAPGVTLCGHVHISAGAFIGAGSTVIPGIQVGAKSILGAGAVSVRDIGDNQIVMGVPATQRREK